MPRRPTPTASVVHDGDADAGRVRVWPLVLVQSVLAALLMLGIVLARPAPGEPAVATGARGTDVEASYPHAMEAR